MVGPSNPKGLFDDIKLHVSTTTCLDCLEEEVELEEENMPPVDGNS